MKGLCNIFGLWEISRHYIGDFLSKNLILHRYTGKTKKKTKQKLHASNGTCIVKNGAYFIFQPGVKSSMSLCTNTGYSLAKVSKMTTS